MNKYEYILLDIKKPKSTYDFHPNAPLILGPNPQVGLKNLFMWHTFPNISSAYRNNMFKYSVSVNTWESVTIPEGMYDIDDLNKIFLDLGINATLKVNTATFKCFLDLGTNVKIDLSYGDFHKILGLEKKIYTMSEEGKQIINITRGVDKIFIRCNLVNRPYQKEYNDVLFDVLPVGTPGGAIYETLDTVEYHQCKNSVVRQIEIRITDQDNNLVKLTEHLSLKLVFKCN